MARRPGRQPPRLVAGRMLRSRWCSSRAAPYWQVAPLALVFAVFFLLPLLFDPHVSFWRYNEY